MKDLELWRALGAAEPDAERLVPLLAELAAQPVTVRAPYWGRLDACLASEDSRLRRATLAVLGGAQGYRGWQQLVQALDDPAPAIRETTAAAFRQSASGQESRSVHLLFHADPDVRRRALIDPPPGMSHFMVLLLVADPDCRDLVRLRLHSLALDASHLLAILDLHDAGHLDPIETRSLLLTLLARVGPRNVLDHLEVAEPIPKPAPTLVALLTLAARSTRDPLDRILAVFLHATNVQIADLARLLFNVELQPDREARIAFSAARVGTQLGEWPAHMVAFVAAAMPPILRHGAIDLQVRQAAARLLSDLDGTPTADDPLRDLVHDPVLRNAAGELDLGVIRGLLSRTTQNRFSLLCRRFDLDELLTAFRNEPDEGLFLLRQPPEPAQRAAFRKVLEAVISDTTGTNPERLAPMISMLPGEWLWLLEQLALKRVDMVLGVARETILRDLDGRAKISGGGRRRLVGALAPPLARHALGDLLTLLAQIPDVHRSAVAMELLHDAAVRVKPRKFAKQVKALDARVLARFAEILAQVALFPLSTIQAVLPVLAKHGDENVRRAAEALLPTHGEHATVRGPTAGTRAVELGRRERESISIASEVDLGAALAPIYRSPATGLCEALAARAAPAVPLVEVCVALLVCHDAPDEVCREWLRFGSDEPAFLSRVDKVMVERCAYSDGVSWLGAAWLHKWEARLFQFSKHVIPGFGDFAAVLRFTTPWRAPVLAAEVWRAVARQLGIWRYRDRERMLRQATAGLGELAVDNLRRVGLPAADILVTMFQGRVDPELMDQLRERVYPLLGTLDRETLRRLSWWLDTASAAVSAAPAGPLTPAIAAPDDLAERIAAETDIGLLTKWLLRGVDRAVRLALERLADMGAAGRAAVLGALCHEPPPICVRLVAAVVEHWPDGLEVEAARDLALDPGRAPPLRFALGVALMLRGEAEIWPAIVESVCAESAQPWFASQDWETLLALAPSDHELAIATVTSPHTAAYARAVPALLLEEPAGPEALDALRAFLERDSNRLGELRVRAARRLQEHGDWRGFPIIYADDFARKEASAGSVSPLLVGAAPDLVRGAARALAVGGGTVISGPDLLRAIDQAGVDPRAREQAYLDLLKSTASPAIHNVILRRLAPRSSRAVKLRRLAETFAWGVRQSRSLAGRRLEVRMSSGGALGYTRLGTRSIHVSPLPILRGERGADAVTRGLILHEIGHHLFNADEESMRISEEAAAAGLHPLLNLVQDEHLERNLRAGNETAGNDLKTLAAYAFQHTDQEIVVQDLLDRLGARSFPVLSASQLSVARVPVCVRVRIGGVLRELEASASSFSRFLRALRMGLGKRHGDPKVGEALGLFSGSRFRRSGPQDLWRITQRLYEIFGDEIQLLDVFDMHGVLAGDDADTRIHGEGISDDEVQAAIERILNPQGDRTSDRQEGGQSVNRSGETSFDRITTVVPVDLDPAAHRLRARSVAHAARRMRQWLEHLGLRLEPRPRRVRGRAIDRGRLEAGLLRGDPRLLVAREPVFRTDLFMGVITDCSGSMAVDDNMEKARLFGTMLAEAAKGLRGIDVRFWGFTDQVIFDAGDAQRCAVSGLDAGGGNNDAAALWHASREALASGRRARLLVMISDGAPTECSVEALRDLARELTRRNRVACAQVAVRPLDDICFPHYVEVDYADLNAAVRRFGMVIAKLVGKMLGAA